MYVYTFVYDSNKINKFTEQSQDKCNIILCHNLIDHA